MNSASKNNLQKMEKVERGHLQKILAPSHSLKKMETSKNETIMPAQTSPDQLGLRQLLRHHDALAKNELMEAKLLGKCMKSDKDPLLRDIKIEWRQTLTSKTAREPMWINRQYIEVQRLISREKQLINNLYTNNIRKMLHHETDQSRGIISLI